MKQFSLVALLSVVILSGCAVRSKPCRVPALPAPQPVVEVTPVPVAAEVAPTPQPEVTQPTPEPTPAPAVPAVDQVAFDRVMADIYFDYDKSTIRADQQVALQSNIAFLRDNPTVTFSIVSSCDVRGTSAYNVALGQRRVDAVHAALAAAGVDGDRMVTASTIGKTSTYCSTTNESCYQLNRRVHFVFGSAK